MSPVPSQNSCQYSSHRFGTTSQNISLKATPIPAIISTGKNSTPRRHRHPSSSESNSKEKPNSPAKIHINETPVITNRSLLMKISIIRIKNKMRSINFNGDLNRQDHPPHVSSQH